MTPPHDQRLPCPTCSIRIDLPPDVAANVDLQSLPARPGVYLFEDDSGMTIALAMTANLRRMVAARMEAPDAGAVATRRVHYRAVTRVIRAVPVGSGFEADWAYLQLARVHLPRTYQSALDRWQAWFIHVDPQAPHPQFVKTAHPGRGPVSCGICLGPFPDKHAAGRYIEVLQDVFDLCRYHHILVQAPHATACAYKEMGKCPAPCDGSVTLDSYRSQVLDAIEFASMSSQRWRENMEQAIGAASASGDLDQADRLRKQLDRSAPAAKPQFAQVTHVDRFCFLAVCTAETRGWSRLFLIRGGWIEPVGDLGPETTTAQVNEILDQCRKRLEPWAADLSDPALENLGLACWHLFRPRGKRSTGEFLRLDDHLSAQTILRVTRRLHRRDASADAPDTIAEQSLDAPPTS